MEKDRIEEVENSVQPAAVMRALTEPLGTTDLAVNCYQLEPWDSFAFAYHSRDVQEEVFYVQAGTATFETEAGPIEVDAGEMIRFDRGEFQRGWNRGVERVRALALGAPLEYGDQPKLRHCPDCEDEPRSTLAEADDGDAVVARCEVCGTETGRWVCGSMDGEVP